MQKVIERLQLTWTERCALVTVGRGIVHSNTRYGGKVGIDLEWCLTIVYIVHVLYPFLYSKKVKEFSTECKCTKSEKTTPTVNTSFLKWET